MTKILVLAGADGRIGPASKPGAHQGRPREAKMKLWKKMESPLALVVQGFVAGAVLFFTLQPIAGADREPPNTAGEGSVLESLQI